MVHSPQQRSGESPFLLHAPPRRQQPWPRVPPATDTAVSTRERRWEQTGTFPKQKLTGTAPPLHERERSQAQSGNEGQPQERRTHKPPAKTSGTCEELLAVRQTALETAGDSQDGCTDSLESCCLQRGSCAIVPSTGAPL